MPSKKPSFSDRSPSSENRENAFAPSEDPAENSRACRAGEKAFVAGGSRRRSSAVFRVVSSAKDSA